MHNKSGAVHPLGCFANPSGTLTIRTVKKRLDFDSNIVHDSIQKKRHRMRRIILDQDIKPMSEFRAHTAACIKQVQKTKRPVVITQNGKSAAVLIDVMEFESISRRLELLEDIANGESQIDSGAGISHDNAKKLVLERISK